MGKKSASTGDCLSAISRTNIFFKCTMRFENWRTNGFFWDENYEEEKEKSETKRRKI